MASKSKLIAWVWRADHTNGAIARQFVELDGDVRKLWHESDSPDTLLWTAGVFGVHRPHVVMAACAVLRRALPALQGYRDHALRSIQLVERWVRGDWSDGTDLRMRALAQKLDDHNNHLCNTLCRHYLGDADRQVMQALGFLAQATLSSSPLGAGTRVHEALTACRGVNAHRSADLAINVRWMIPYEAVEAAVADTLRG